MRLSVSRFKGLSIWPRSACQPGRKTVIPLVQETVRITVPDKVTFFRHLARLILLRVFLQITIPPVSYSAWVSNLGGGNLNSLSGSSYYQPLLLCCLIPRKIMISTKHSWCETALSELWINGKDTGNNNVWWRRAALTAGKRTEPTMLARLFTCV